MSRLLCQAELLRLWRGEPRSSPFTESNRRPSPYHGDALPTELVFQTKLIKRGISLKALDAGEPAASGKEYRLSATLKEGIDQENAKKISKLIRDEAPKSVKAQIQGEELRVSSKSRDDLQAVQALLKEADLAVPVQFVNYR
jgi:uncharacterized protein YajQ (UPF0234 family)